MSRDLHRLVDVLKDFSRLDWQLGSMACQILWNYSGRITSSNAMFGEQEAQELSDTLVDLLGQSPPSISSTFIFYLLVSSTASIAQ